MNAGFDRLSLLATFIRIVERGSISAAARDLGISQASASRQLSALEQQFGAHLINRTTHSLALTDAGAQCLADARGLLEGWDAMVEQLNEDGERDRLQGPLKVVAPVALGQLHLAQAVLGYQRQHPDVTVTWLLQDEVVRFAEIGCDLWIRVGAVPDDTLIVRSLGEVERLLVAAPMFADGAVLSDPEQLANFSCAALAPYEGGQLVLTNTGGQTRSVEAQVRFSSDNIFAVREAVLSGSAYALMPRWMVDGELRSEELVNLLPDWRGDRLTVNAAYQPVQRQTQRLSALIDHISAAVAAIPGVEPCR